MISLSVPGIAQMVQSQILSLIYLDILMADQWLTPFITKQLDPDSIFVEKGLNEFFEQSGFSSKNIIVNLGSTVIYIAFYLL